jgi:hypothetical protein
MYRSAFLLLIAIALPLGGAGDAALDRATLRGIASVNVVIDPVAPEIQKEGATADVLRARMQERLQQGGLRIDPSSTDFVAIRLTSVQGGKASFGGKSSFAIAVSVAVYQPVTLVRDKSLRTVTQTWEVETIVLADAKQVNAACLDSVDELAARFLAAYKSVNVPGADRIRDK